MAGRSLIPSLQATVPALAPPGWAILQRRLIDLLNASVEPFAAKYTRPDGELIWREHFVSRDGLDDAYEGFYNWPLLYLLGGDEGLLPRSLHHWNGVTRQFGRYGHVHREFDRGYDWFHLGEGLLAFYFLCLAAPDLPANRDRARRFAGFYLEDEDEHTPNYDPRLKLVRAPHNGSIGPRWGLMDDEPIYEWSPTMRPYGLPFHDIPGIAEYDDLRDPLLARRMGQAMAERMGLGDVPANLAITSLVTNAFCLTGDERYREWVVEYTEAWMARARENGGLLPDNVGLAGAIGEYNNGKWYGGLYGWTWPHGFYNIGMAAVIAGCNATVLTGDEHYLDLPRGQIDYLLELGERSDNVVSIPHRYSDFGWFDYGPLDPWLPMAIWNLSQSPDDLARLESMRIGDEDRNEVRAFRNKHDDGHEGPWLSYLSGQNDGYPERMLRQMMGQVARRLEQIRVDTEDLNQVNLHHWQQLNPVTTEGLLHLTLGGPSPIYNGGLLLTALRYFDAERRRPGLPPDVAALVERLGREQIVVHLVNINPLAGRTVVVQSGALGEHHIEEVRFAERTSDYPGPIGADEVEVLKMSERRLVVNGRHLQVHLPPGARVTLDLRIRRLVQPPTYMGPWG